MSVQQSYTVTAELKTKDRFDESDVVTDFGDVTLTVGTHDPLDEMDPAELADHVRDHFRSFLRYEDLIVVGISNVRAVRDEDASEQ